MRTNLIQSYVNGTPLVQQYNSDKAVKDFDVKKELSNRTFIKPLPSNGKLIRNSIFDMPSQIFKDAKYDWNALKHAIKGEANDHELGKMNDLGMKVGGLAIASYLFTKKQTPKTKIFEFIGLASFFGAMDLWPKLFLQLPAYLVHGVNVRQQYEDSFGRKKMFYLDHQFIPWDLYSDEEINKIGDRLRVPKDIPNRRDFIQEKMRKIALQNNTMWMLTAGFATPIMSALICNALDKTVDDYQAEKLDKKADALLSNFTNEYQKFNFKKNEEALAKILSENSGKPVTTEMVESLHANLSEGLDFVTSESIKTDLQNMLPTDKYTFSNETLDAVRDALKKNFSEMALSEDELAKILPDNNSMLSAFTEKGLMNEGIKDFSEHSKLVQNLLEEKIEKFISDNPDSMNAKKLNFYMKNLVHSSELGADSELAGAFKFKPSAVLTEEMVKKLKSISGVLNEFKAKNSVLDKFAFMKTAQAPETGLAKMWNDISSADLLKTLNLTQEDVKKCRLDSEIAGNILRNKFEEIVSDDAKYAQVVETLQQKLSLLQSKLAPLTELKNDDSTSVYKTQVTSTFDEAANSLKSLNMGATAENLVGRDGNTQATLKDLQLSFVTDRISGVKSSFYRLLNTLDMYHRISKIENVDVLSAHMPREVKEELVELCKQTLIDGHTSDYAVKFYVPRNPDLNPTFANEQARNEYFSQIETKDGKVVNKYLGTRPATDMVELSHDRDFFDAAMKLMYDGELHPDTTAKIKDSAFMADFMKYRSDVLTYIGGDQYFLKGNHLVNGVATESTSELRSLLVGCAPNEMFFKLCKQRFNSLKWFKTFGSLGAGLVGVTLLSQLFMGRMKPPKVNKENK